MIASVQDSLNNRPDPRMAIMDMNQTVDKVGNEMGYVDKVSEDIKQDIEEIMCELKGLAGEISTSTQGFKEMAELGAERTASTLGGIKMIQDPQLQTAAQSVKDLYRKTVKLLNQGLPGLERTNERNVQELKKRLDTVPEKVEKKRDELLTSVRREMNTRQKEANKMDRMIKKQVRQKAERQLF